MGIKKLKKKVGKVASKVAKVTGNKYVVAAAGLLPGGAYTVDMLNKASTYAAKTAEVSGAIEKQGVKGGILQGSKVVLANNDASGRINNFFNSSISSNNLVSYVTRSISSKDMPVNGYMHEKSVAAVASRINNGVGLRAAMQGDTKSIIDGNRKKESGGGIGGIIEAILSIFGLA